MDRIRLSLWIALASISLAACNSEPASPELTDATKSPRQKSKPSKKDEGKQGAILPQPTPELAFAALRKAIHGKDGAAIMQAMTPDGRNFMVATFVILGDRIVMARHEKAAEITAAFQRHGLDPDPVKRRTAIEGMDFVQSSRTMTRPIREKGAFVSDMLGWIETNIQKGAGLRFEGELKDLKIDGDVATAVFVKDQNGLPIHEPFQFRRMGGGWLVDYPDQAALMASRPRGQTGGAQGTSGPTGPPLRR